MSGTPFPAGNRRGETLRRLAALKSTGVAEPCRAAAAILADNPCDVPFAALYHLDPTTGRACLCDTIGVALCGWQFPNGFAPGEPDPDPRLPLTTAMREERPWDAGDLSELGLRVTNPPWGDVARRAILLPMPGKGLLVAGLDPRTPLDAGYRAFLNEMAELIGRAL